MYLLYGLRISSALPLPCPAWQGPERNADVELVEASEEEILASCKAPPSHYQRDDFWECREFDDGATRATWKDHFEFFVSGNGTRVLWRRLADVPDEVLFTYLLNQALSQCLLARGIETLHATGIVVNGNAIAILGDSGYGKSTLAAALMREGHALLTDDVLVLDFEEQGVFAHPSLARLKLNPDAADAVFEQRRSLPMNSFTTKMILPLEASEHSARRVPLRALFVIRPASGTSKISIRRARGHRALLPLIENTFTTTLLGRRRLKQQFRSASRLAEAVPIKFLSYPRQWDRLPDVAAAILADLQKEAVAR